MVIVLMFLPSWLLLRSSHLFFQFSPSWPYVEPVVEIRADFETPNPHGEHLSSVDGATRLLPFWERAFCSQTGMPTMTSMAVAPVSLFRACLRGQGTILDLRRLFVIVCCFFVLHIGVGLDLVWFSLLVW